MSLGRKEKYASLNSFAPTERVKRVWCWLLRRANAQVILVAAEDFEDGVGRFPGQQLI